MQKRTETRKSASYQAGLAKGFIAINEDVAPPSVERAT